AGLQVMLTEESGVVTAERVDKHPVVLRSRLRDVCGLSEVDRWKRQLRCEFPRHDTVQLLNRSTESRFIDGVGAKQARQVSNKEIRHSIVVVAVIAGTGTADLLVRQQALVVKVAQVQSMSRRQIEREFAEVIVDRRIHGHTRFG